MRLTPCAPGNLLRLHALLVGALVAAISVSTDTIASDLDKEARWAEQIVDQLFDGEPVRLTDGAVEFLALFTPATTESKGAVVVMHGIGVHPDWPQVVNPLRVGLTEHGWDTLSIQMPILPNEATGEDYAPLMAEVPGRINAALDYLGDNSSGQVYLVAHSMGSTMTLSYFSSDQAKDVKGLVMVGNGSGAPGGSDPEAGGVARLDLPVLDLYGEADLESVLKGAPVRRRVAETAGNNKYLQRVVAGADHFFEGYDAELVAAVAEWLDAQCRTVGGTQ